MEGGVQMRKTNARPFFLNCLLIMLILLCGCQKDTKRMRDFQSQKEQDIKQDNIFTGIKPIDSMSGEHILVLGDDKYNTSHIASDNIFLACLDDDEVILSKQSVVAISAGNFTKIPAAMVAIEKCDLSTPVIITTDIYNVSNELLRCKFTKNDTVTVEDLLYGSLVHCGNDVAIPLSVAASGSMTQFVSDMNAYAQEAGAAATTNLSNAYGYPAVDSVHQTSLFDVYLMVKKGLENETFLQIISTFEYACKYTDYNGQPAGVRFHNAVPFFSEDYPLPQGLQLIGGLCEREDMMKGQMLVIVENPAGKRYVAMIVGTASYRDAYDQMCAVLENIPTN